MTARGLLAFAACAACGSGDPCDDVSATCVTVRVTSESIAAIDTLELDISYKGFHATASTTSDSTKLPLATGVELAGATTPVEVGIVAAGKLDGTLLGTGYSATETLGVGDHAPLEIPLALIANPCTLGTYCGTNRVDGDPNTLYLCHPNGVPTARGVCTNGCIRNTSDDDVCSGGNLRCTQGNTYCGGHELDGDPQWLYRCDATGKGVFVEDCEAAGKRCAPQGADTDSCR